MSPSFPQPDIRPELNFSAGEGRQARKALCDKTGGLWSKLINQGELSEEEWGRMENYVRVLCEDINLQRRRIGGNWAIAGCFPVRRIRDVLRSAFIIDQY